MYILRYAYPTSSLRFIRVTVLCAYRTPRFILYWLPCCALVRLPRSVLCCVRDPLCYLFQVELVQTACYGVRVYTNTSWLANHVDTRATHAVSVIMQVDQVSAAKGAGGE